MPLKYKIFEDRKLVYVVGVGIVTFDELMDHVQELAADSGYQSPMKKLIDYRTTKGFKISDVEANQFLQNVIALKDVFRGETCAFVVTRELDFGMLRMFEARSEVVLDINTNVFRKMEEAMDWLDVELTDEEINSV